MLVATKKALSFPLPLEGKLNQHDFFHLRWSFHSKKCFLEDRERNMGLFIFFLLGLDFHSKYLKFLIPERDILTWSFYGFPMKKVHNCSGYDYLAFKIYRTRLKIVNFIIVILYVLSEFSVIIYLICFNNLVFQTCACIYKFSSFQGMLITTHKVI